MTMMIYVCDIFFKQIVNIINLKNYRLQLLILISNKNKFLSILANYWCIKYIMFYSFFLYLYLLSFYYINTICPGNFNMYINTGPISLDQGPVCSGRSFTFVYMYIYIYILFINTLNDIVSYLI